MKTNYPDTSTINTSANDYPRVTIVVLEIEAWETKGAIEYDVVCVRPDYPRSEKTLREGFATRAQANAYAAQRRADYGI